MDQLDASKEAQEVIFNRKIKKKTLIHPRFSIILLSQTNNSRKQVGLKLDFQLTFEEHFLNVFKKNQNHKTFSFRICY